MENESALVTIAIPLYNAEKLVPRCIQSLQRQTHAALDILIVDDGSTDASGAIADQYAATDSRVRVIHTPNGGTSRARNIAIDSAKGQWLMFCDADDFFTEDAVETAVRFATENHLQVARFAAHMVFPDGRKTAMRFPPFEAGACSAVMRGDAFLAQCYTFRSPIAIVVWAALYDVAFVRSAHVRFPDGQNVGEDYYFSTLLYLKAERVAYLNHVLYQYVHNAASVTHAGKSAAKQAGTLSCLNLLEPVFRGTPNTPAKAKVAENCAVYYMRCAGTKEIWNSPHRQIVNFSFAKGKVKKPHLRIAEFLFRRCPVVFVYASQIARFIWRALQSLRGLDFYG
jgi:glycosyltransferase involved in cell wall biosynthesis